MIKRTLYPETPRIPEKTNNGVVTEKMDGENLTILKYNGELLIAQRNKIFNLVPASAGVIPHTIKSNGVVKTCPRIRGGDPPRMLSVATPICLSPHPRG